MKKILFLKFNKKKNAKEIFECKYCGTYFKKQY